MRDLGRGSLRRDDATSASTWILLTREPPTQFRSDISKITQRVFTGAELNILPGGTRWFSGRTTDSGRLQGSTGSITWIHLVAV